MSKPKFLVNEVIGYLKIIEDLGTKQVTPNSNYKIRFVLVECLKCGLHIEGRYPKFKEGLKVCPCSDKRKGLREIRPHWLKILKLWHLIKYRCYDQKSNCYDRYGALGIEVCDQWLKSSESFYYWAIKNGYEQELTIDRIDSSKGYSPENCRWATTTQQNRNRKNTLKDGEVEEIKQMLRNGDKPVQIAKKYNVPVKRIYYIKTGYTWY
jgi:hypothetical protein